MDSAYYLLYYPSLVTLLTGLFLWKGGRFIRTNQRPYEKIIQRKVSHGQGSGHNESYRSWIMPWDLSSKGRMHEISFSRTGGCRKHVFLSDLEEYYFLNYDFNPNVLDIREQFPLLDRNLTLVIAAELGIKHPVYPDGKTPIVPTADLVIDYINKEGNRAQAVRSVKYARELMNRRTLEKLALEQEYFVRKLNIKDWSVVTERGISSIRCKNLEAINECLIIRDNIFYYSFLDSEIKIMEVFFLTLYKSRGYADSDLYSCFESEFNLKQGAGRVMLKHLIAQRKIIIDLERPLEELER